MRVLQIKTQNAEDRINNLLEENEMQRQRISILEADKTVFTIMLD